MEFIILGKKMLVGATNILFLCAINYPVKAFNVPEAFSPADTCIRVACNETDRGRIYYTIQICTLAYPIGDLFIGGQNKIRLIHIGDVFRYIFSMYPSLEEARKDLPMVRNVYPKAYIREYYGGKLGKAYDIDHSEYKNTKL